MAMPFPKSPAAFLNADPVKTDCPTDFQPLSLFFPFSAPNRIYKSENTTPVSEGALK
jgi:hypothetical protein